MNSFVGWFIAAVVLVGGLIFWSNWEKVPAGYVGVKVHLLGSDKGVDTEELGTGRYYIGMNDELYTFPTFSQNQIWTLSKNEGSPNDDSLTFQSVEGLEINTDIGITYNVKADHATKIFQKYRKGIDEITSLYLRNMVRDALVTTASTMSIADIYGAKKADLMANTIASVRDQTKDIGINIEKIYWIGKMRLPTSVETAINDKVNASQKTVQRENEVAQAKAEANKVIEAARGEAQSKLLIAQAEAQAITIKGKALNDSPKIIELNAVEKWNGTLPVYTMGTSTPFINLGEIK
jgi:regulator of protease activity HflC (stomatin/prohibitin superfamily)